MNYNNIKRAQTLTLLDRCPQMADRMRSVLKTAFDSGAFAGQCTANPIKSVQRFSEKKRDRYISCDVYTWPRSQARHWSQ